MDGWQMRLLDVGSGHSCPAQVKARLEAIANGTSTGANGSKGRTTVAQLRESVVSEVPAAALPN